MPAKRFSLSSMPSRMTGPSSRPTGADSVAASGRRRATAFPTISDDFDALMDEISPVAPVRIVGHSMGGNIANLYAGLRPERVRCVINLEGFGLPRTSPQESPEAHAQMARSNQESQRWKKATTPSSSWPRSFNFAIRDFPRPPRHSWRAFGELADENDRVRLAADPRHHWVNPILYKREDAEATWREIRAPLLMVLGEESDYLTRLGADGTTEAIARRLSRCRGGQHRRRRTHAAH